MQEAAEARTCNCQRHAPLVVAQIPHCIVDELGEQDAAGGGQLKHVVQGTPVPGRAHL